MLQRFFQRRACRRRVATFTPSLQSNAGVQAGNNRVALLLKDHHVALQVVAYVKPRPSEVAGRYQLLPNAHEQVTAAGLLPHPGRGGHFGQDAKAVSSKGHPSANKRLLEVEIRSNAQPEFLIHPAYASGMGEALILGCPINVSEGRSRKVIDEVASAAGAGANVLDVSSDPDHNRTVISLAGNREQIVNGALSAASRAVELIDLRKHTGVHPRMGAADVIPFTPYRNASVDDAVVVARSCAERLWDELRVPSFLFERAAFDGEAATLPWVRRHAFKDLPPSFGGPYPHVTAGASAVGAREALVAFNVNLKSDDLEAAKSIASALRRGALRRRGLRTLGLRLPRRGRVQVSTNLTRPDTTTALEVLQAVEDLASRFGIAVMDTEFVGLVPRLCVGDSDLPLLKAREPPKILETALDTLCRAPA